MITKGRYDLEDNESWKTVSAEAKDLIRKLMQPDPNKRISAIDALEHAWIVCTLIPNVTKSIEN